MPLKANRVVVALLLANFALTGCKNEEERALEALQAESMGLIEVCPNPSDDHQAMIDFVYIGPKQQINSPGVKSADKKSVYRMTSVNLKTGKRSGRTRVAVLDMNKMAPTCFGQDGGRAWVLVNGKLQLFDAKTGARVHDATGLRNKSSVLGNADQHAFDTDEGKLWVMTKDGRAHYVDATTLQATKAPARIDGSKRRSGSTGWGFTNIYSNPSSVSPGIPLDLGDGKKLVVNYEGQRGSFTVDGKELPADYLVPRFFHEPKSQKLLWSKPPSLVFAEAKSMDKKAWSVVRVDLTGKTLMKVGPSPVYLRAKTKTFPWRFARGGATLLHFGANEITAYDGVSGKQQWRSPY